METKGKLPDSEKVNKREISKLKIGSFMVIAFLLIYIPSFFYWIYGRSIDTDIIRLGEIEKALSIEGIIVRDEEVIKSSFNGNCIFEVEEGEKVPVNGKVVTVLNESSNNILAQLKEIDTKIINIQREKLNLKKIFSGDIEKIDMQIGETLDYIIEASNRNNISNESHLKEEVDKLIMKKADMLGDTGTADTYTKTLRARRDILEEQIRQNTNEIVSGDSGIVSYVIDGNETILNPNGIKEFTPDFLEKIDTQQSVNNGNNKKVEIGQPFVRVIKSIYYEILAVIDSKKAAGFKAGEQKEIRINDIGKTILGTIEYISPIKEGKCFISIKTDEALNDTLQMRKISCDIILDSYDGLKVPLDSLKNISSNGNGAEIVLVKAKCADFREVEIIGKDNGFAILKYETDGSVKLYDTYVLKPGNIVEGQMLP